MTPSTAYAPPGFRAAIELDLSKNEGRAPRGVALPADLVRDLARYPDLRPLQSTLAALVGVDVDRVLVTAGADDALLRLCLCTLRSGGEALVATPTFEMIERYVAMAGGELVAVPWPEGALPVDALLAKATPRTRIVFVVSPNNPTGAVATAADLRRIAVALPDALLVLDAAYAEFADADLTPIGLTLPNCIVVRTLSKAWGLAGLRVGWAIGAPAAIARLAACGNPMPVSIASARAAVLRLRDGAADLADHVAQVRRERADLVQLLRELGAEPALPAQGNFVLARGVDPRCVTDALAALGIAVRRFPERPDLQDAVRIGLPGDAAAFARLVGALRAALRPEAVLFDLDGVLADVSRSYRAAIVQTAAAFGVVVTGADIEAAKARGNANDDWALTRALLAARGVDVPLAVVTERFEAIYQPLRLQERLLVPGATLRSLQARRRLAVVTGRPRRDAMDFLDRHGITACFDAVVCREDAPLKPDPAPVRRALAALGVEAAWMVGDTPDDVTAARAAGVVPIGAIAPGSDPTRAEATLFAAGAAFVLTASTELEDLLP